MGHYVLHAHAESCTSHYHCAGLAANHVSRSKWSDPHDSTRMNGALCALLAHATSVTQSSMPWTVHTNACMHLPARITQILPRTTKDHLGEIPRLPLKAQKMSTAHGKNRLARY